MISLDRFRGCLLGLACGDAVGVSCEFMPRGSFEPLTGMTGGGPFDLKPGEWTDDTSMALCLATSLVESKGFNALDQMERYLDWYENGTMSSTGECFDIGNTTRDALMRFRQSGEPFSGSTDPYSAGNGSLMRLAPVVLKFFPDREQTLQFCAGEFTDNSWSGRMPGCLPVVRRHASASAWWRRQGCDPGRWFCGNGSLAQAGGHRQGNVSG